MVSSVPRAVDVDRAAFEHDAGHEAPACPSGSRHCVRHRVVVLPRRVLSAPGVVAPVDRRRLAPAARSRGRRRSARGRGTRRRRSGMMKCIGRVVERHTAGMQTTRGTAVLHRRIVDQDVDRARAARARAPSRPRCRGIGCEVARPRGFLVRPRQPGRRVRLPLGRHAKAEPRGRRRSRRAEQPSACYSESIAAASARRTRRCGGRAGTASCGGLLDQREIAAHDQDLLAIVAGARDHSAERDRDERSAPELDGRSPSTGRRG